MVLKFLKIHLGTSFQRKFLWAIIPFIFFINLLFSVAFGLTSAYQLSQQLTERYTEVARARAKVLVEPIWVLELDRVQKLLDELVLSGDIVKAEIDASGEQLNSVAKIQPTVSLQKVVVPIIYTDAIQVDKLGTLTITFSTAKVSGILFRKIAESTVVSILLSFVLSFYIFWVTKQQVVRPLTLLTDTITQSSQENKRHHVPWESNDEFGQVISNFNSMQVTLDREEEKLRQVNQRLDYIAYNDNLTSLPNRACCLFDMNDRFDKSKPDQHFSLIHLDLDNFKQVNDSLGHHAGDHLLSTIGHRLALIVSDHPNSKAYRWGGDEFIVLFDLRDGDLEDFCCELTDLLNVPLPYKSSTLWPSASVGAAVYPKDGDTFASLMISSDLALYKTKDLGRDSYQFFTEELKEAAQDKIHIEEDFRKALEANDQLFMAFQPQVDSRTFEVTGLEALIRWKHPERGFLSPALFLPILEESKLAQSLGRFVYDSSCRAARHWLDEGLVFGSVAINLSAKHIKLGTALPDFYDTLKRYSLETKHITAEVTESLFLDEKNRDGLDMIDDLHKNGVRIELDDFGTGFAALSHLSTLPIDGLKIDRSFTQMMLSDKKKAIIIKSLFDMTKMLRIGLVCEGVETRDQLARLQTMGQSSIQGYYTARPMPFAEVTEWMKQGKNYEFLASNTYDYDVDAQSS
ncbi:MAG: putative bifunctional diguanylate cyclase/phosphodiesterase [Methyloligellaceae bacterium]